MHLRRELQSLVVVALAVSNVSATSSDRHLRGSGDGFGEHPSLRGEERKLLKREREASGGNNGNGKGHGYGRLTDAPTQAPTAAVAPEPLPLEPIEGGLEAPLPPPEGGAEAPPANSTSSPTPTPIPAVCDPACGSDEVCARSSPSAEAQCYPSCGETFPIESTIVTAENCTSPCVHSTFTCQGHEGVFNDFCECGIDGSYVGNCRPSECGLAAP